jgi:hypothetical protein
MVEIQCPHCEDDIELEDGVFGLFDCPYCNQEFEWEDDESLPSNPITIFVKIFLLSTSFIILAVFVILLFLGGGEAIVLTPYILLILSPVLIPLALLPSCIYLFRHRIQKISNN